MNVIISNKNKEILEELDIDTIKEMNGEYSVDELIQTFSNFFFNKMLLDITAIKGYQKISNLQKLSMNLDMDKVIILLDNNSECDSRSFLSQLISMGIYNFTKTKEGLEYLYNNPNSYKDVAHIQQLKEEDIHAESYNKSPNSEETKTSRNNLIIGFTNVTENAGASTLIYMLKKLIKEHYNVIALQINSKDFIYFEDKDMLSILEMELGNTIMKYRDKDLILLDLGNKVDTNIERLCDEIIYLVEPTTIKLNKLLFLHKKIFSKLKDRKIVLNKSLISKKDISKFECETSTKVFYNIEPLNDKELNREQLLPFLEKLGIIKMESTKEVGKKSKGIFDLFKIKNNNN